MLHIFMVLVYYRTSLVHYRTPLVHYIPSTSRTDYRRPLIHYRTPLVGVKGARDAIIGPNALKLLVWIQARPLSGELAHVRHAANDAEAYNMRPDHPYPVRTFHEIHYEIYQARKLHHEIYQGWE